MYTPALSSVTEHSAMNITSLLVVVTLALAGATARADDESAETPPQQLDLRPPDITKLYTSEQLQQLIAKLDAKNIEEIEVEGARMPPPIFTPQVWPAIAAPFWALFHPTQAWRILAPLPPDQARAIANRPPPDTSGYLEPIGVPPGDPFKD
jgi:hypothetical protein